MSSRDIDSTSENVLHDWEREEAPGEDQDALDVEAAAPDEGDDGSPAWGAATVTDEPAESDDPVVAAVEQEQEPGPEAGPGPEETDSADAEEEALEQGEADIDEAPMHVELSQEHAAGDLHIPDGYAVLEGVAEGGRRAVGIVVSRFNGKVTTQLLDSALAELSTAGVAQEAITIMVVPGAFELPLAATALAKTRRFACIVALGCIIRGDTPHFDYVSSEAASGLQLAALETGVPVSFGVLTLDRVEQAEPRVGKGAESARSALEMADLFAHLRAAAAR